MFSGPSGACAYVLDADNAVSIAAPPSPARNSRRLGSDGGLGFPESEAKLSEVSEDCLQFIDDLDPSDKKTFAKDQPKLLASAL
jgi:hypothetical protein